MGSGFSLYDIYRAFNMGNISMAEKACKLKICEPAGTTLPGKGAAKGPALDTRETKSRGRTKGGVAATAPSAPASSLEEEIR